MVEKRKRAGSDAAASAHSASEASADERAPKQVSAPDETATNRATVPFADGAELHQALKTPSADLLRLLLTRLRNQTNLSFAENTQRSTIPASDRRIQLVKDFCQLCETQASNSGAPTAAAASIFTTWELADRQDLPTLLHLPIFCLAQSLALLSIHYPTHTLGANIIERILSPNEPWLAMLHNYISNLGGAKFASSKQRDARSSKGSDVAALASLVLLREITTFAKGRYAVKLFDSFNWSMKVLPHIFNMRRRSNRKSKAKKASVAQDVSLRRPDIRTLYILFLLSFLQQSYSNTLKLRLLDLGRDFLPAMLKGLPQDPPDVVQTVLLHLHEDLVKDQRLPRSKKVEFWNEWACGCVVQLYAREDEHVLIHADTEAVQNPSVAELAHHFLLSICTNPGFGICYPDRGWYPRKASARGDADDTAPTGGVDGAANGLQKDNFSFEMGPTQRAKSAAGSGGGSIYNKVLSGVLRQLAASEDLLQQELALGILAACPELVGQYLESSCAGLSVDPRPSSRWLCNVAFFGRVAGLELPSFRNAKVEHLESEAVATSSAIVPLSHRLYASEPPPIATVLANVLPGPLHRFLFSQGLTSTDKLVRHSTCALLCRCLDRMVRYRHVCLSAVAELDEDETGPWRRHLEILEMEARRRIPDISIIIQILQVATSRSSAAVTSDAAEADGAAKDGAPAAASENINMLSTEVALRLLSLYYQAVPSSAFDVRFNAGKLLTNSFIQASAPSHEKSPDDMETDAADNGARDAEASDSDADDDEEDTSEIKLGALCQVHTLRILSHAARAASFDWTAKPTGSTTSGNLSYLGTLLSLFVSTPLQQVKDACEDLLRSLLAPSSFFEHDPAEIDAWLSSLPQADTRIARPAGEGSDRDTSSALTQQQLSAEQQAVIAFLDECLLRCAKTPYRYIEASRQFLRDNRGSDEEADEAEGAADLLASPWLMALLEQFCIRVDKGLFEDAGSVKVLTAFFVRLLPVLCAYARHTSAFEALAAKIRSHIAKNDKCASSEFMAEVGVSNIRAIRAAPENTSRSPSKSKLVAEAASTIFDGCLEPTELKSQLRSALRPLAQSQVSSLYGAVKRLQERGFPHASQILDELDPVAENVAIALFSGVHEIALGSMPVLHLPLDARFVHPQNDDFMVTEEEDTLDQTTVVPWTTKSHARLALWAAISRGQGKQKEQYLSSHASSLIAAADASEYLADQDAKHFLFTDCVALVSRSASSHVASSLLRQIGELAIKYLDAQHKDHAQMVKAALDTTGKDDTADADHLRCLTHLTPFMDETSAVEVVDKCLNVLGAGTMDADAVAAAAESLAVITATASPESRVWLTLACRLQALVDAVAGSNEAESGFQSLLLVTIKSAIENARDRADLRARLSGLQLGGLVRLSSDSDAADGALVAAIHAHSALAESALASTLSGLSSRTAADLVRALPCTLLTLLSALFEADASPEAGAATLGGQKWSQDHVSAIVNACIDSVLGHADSVGRTRASVEEKHAACLVMALKCASRYSWSKPQSLASDAIVEFAKKAKDTKPSEAFRASLMQVLLGLVEEVPELPSLSDAVQAIVDAALLWLVRRFAEDSNDSAHLVRTISLFTDLVERINGGGARLRIQLRASLVDPVVQAAIKNRLRAIDQMRLVRALCIGAELEHSHLSRYLGALSAHSDFASVMRGSASLLAPLEDAASDEGEIGQLDENIADEDKAQRSQDLKLVAVELVYLIASRDANELIRTPLLAKLLPFYGASLSRADRMLLSLFRKFEETSGQSFGSLMQEWTLASSQGGSPSGHSHSALEALQSLDATVVFATCTEYPRSLPLRNTVALGYEASSSEGDEDEAEAGLPGQVYGLHTDGAQRYDPIFLSSLLARITAPDEKLTGLQWLAVFATNVPGSAVCGLSSRCAEMRRASLTLVSNLYLAVREADFQEKDHLIMVLDLVRDALDSTAAVQESESEAPFLPTTTTLFIAHSLRSVTTPASFIYPAISHFLLQRPELDVGDVPLLYNLLYTASDRVKQERMWMLRFLRDVARSGGRSDWKILKRRRTWELLASLYDSCDPRGAGASAERAVEEAAIRALVEDTTFWLVANADVAIELVTRRGLLTWMWQQVVREGVVALADPSAAKAKVEADREGMATTMPPRSVWMLLLAQLMRSVDLDRLHRATEGAWIAPVLTLVHTTTIALQTCIAAPAAAGLPKASIELVRTITCAAAEVLDRLVPHADDHAREHSHALLGTLDALVELAASALASAGNDRSRVEQACVRIHSALLGVAPALTDAASTRRMASILRQSTALCTRFDPATHALVASTLFQPSPVS